MTRPTCGTCAHWTQTLFERTSGPPLVSVYGRCTAPKMQPAFTAKGDTCIHHTPTARNAGTEDVDVPTA